MTETEVPKSTMSRRRFLIGGSAFKAAGIIGDLLKNHNTIGSVVGSLIVVSLVDVIKDPGALEPLRGDALSEAHSFLFGEGLRYTVIPAFVKYPSFELSFSSDADGVISAPTYDALSSLGQLMKLNKGVVHHTSRIPIKSLTGSLLLLGGPLHNPSVNLLMGRCGTSPILKNRHGRSVRFPLHFDVTDKHRSIRQPEQLYRPEYAGAPLRHNLRVLPAKDMNSPL